MRVAAHELVLFRDASGIHLTLPIGDFPALVSRDVLMGAASFMTRRRASRSVATTMSSGNFARKL